MVRTWFLLVVACAACVTESESATVEFQIRGMVCASCSQAITHEVGALDGVSSCEVDLEGETARVRFDPARISAAAIEAEIDGLGYDAIATRD